MIFYGCFVGLSEEPCTSHLPASEDIAAVAEASPSSSTTSISADDDSLRQPEAEAEASTSETKDKAKTKRNRCFMCRKKVGLTGEYRLLTEDMYGIEDATIHLIMFSPKLIDHKNWVFYV